MKGQNGRKHLQFMYLTRSFYPEYKKNTYHSIIIKTTSDPTENGPTI
jgi:hypothetical protein